MEKLNGPGNSDVNAAIKRKETISGLVTVLRVDVRKNAIKTIFHVGNEVLGTARGGLVIVDLLEREEMTINSKVEGDLDQISGASTEKGGNNRWDVFKVAWGGT